MKRIIPIITAIFLLGLVGAFVYKAVGLLQATEQPKPVVEAKQTELVETLPAVLLDESAESTVKFTIVNSLGRAVKLIDIRTPCACTSATLDRKVLSEGESTTLTVKASFPRQPGVQKLAVYVSEENGHVWRCEMQRKLVASAKFQPTMFSFGTVTAGQESETTATLELAAKTKAELEGNLSLGCNTKSVVAVPEQDDLSQKSDDGFWYRKLNVRLKLKAPIEAGYGQAVVTATVPNSQRTVDQICSWRVDDKPSTASPTPSEEKR
jgi:Protein of unknown function (DUF1573)